MNHHKMVDMTKNLMSFTIQPQTEKRTTRRIRYMQAIE